MKEMLEDYIRKFKTVSRMIQELPNNCPDNLDYIRLQAKRECYRGFISELEREINNENVDFMINESKDKINPKNPTILLELKNISNVYFEKKDYISSGQINRAIDVIEDYFGEINYSKKDDHKDSIDYKIELKE